MSSPAIIELEGLQKSYFNNELETKALRDIHLTVGEGEYVSISGPSGCGKSTLLGLLGLLDVPTAGGYRFYGLDVTQCGSKQRAALRNQQLGFVFQAFNLIADMSVYENVELPLTYRAGLTRAERKRKVMDTLESVQMAHRLHHYPAQLSGGQQQRVAIARALVGEPKVLLADEPTGNLDSKNAHIVMDLIDQLHRQGTTVVMVTHDQRAAQRAQRQLVLFDGRVVEDQQRLLQRSVTGSL